MKKLLSGIFLCFLFLSAGNAQDLRLRLECGVPLEQMCSMPHPWVWNNSKRMYEPSARKETMVTVYLKDNARPGMLDVWCFRAGSAVPYDLYGLIQPDGSILVQYDAGNGGRILQLPPSRYSGERYSRYREEPLSGSRADLRIHTAYETPLWIVEFIRAINTGHPDDLPGSGSLEYALSAQAPGMERVTNLHFQPFPGKGIKP